jgi:hypothetical protein
MEVKTKLCREPQIKQLAAEEELPIIKGELKLIQTNLCISKENLKAADSLATVDF